MNATDPQLIDVRSHTVSLGHNWGGGVEKEEAYPRLTATWRGQAVEVTMRADRYVHSEGWSDWRIFVQNTDPAVTDTAQARLADVCRPLVQAWLDSDAYGPSRARAFAWMIRRELREDRYSGDRSAEVLANHGHELTAEDRERLTAAVEHLQQFLALIDS